MPSRDVRPWPGRAQGLRHQHRKPNTGVRDRRYHRLFTIEKSIRMSKHDLQARPIYHHKRESIEAHLTIVFAALAVTRLIED